MTATPAAAAAVARCGTLFLVVGPSGAGKDSLIHAARGALEAGGSFHFPRRVVTRPADPASEDFESVTVAEFESRRAAGGFCLDWAAHGLLYGVPVTAAAALDRGRSVVVNVSRTVLPAAERRFGSVRVIHVTAPDAVLEQRLAARGRSSDGDLQARRARQVSLPQGRGLDLTTIVNDGPLETAARAFIDSLR